MAALTDNYAPLTWVAAADTTLHLRQSASDVIISAFFVVDLVMSSSLFWLLLLSLRRVSAANCSFPVSVTPLHRSLSTSAITVCERLRRRVGIPRKFRDVTVTSHGGSPIVAWETADNDVRRSSGTGSPLSEHNLLRRQLALADTVHTHRYELMLNLDLVT